MGIEKCAGLRKLKTRKIKKKLVSMWQQVKGIDFNKDDEATQMKKAKYEKIVLKVFKAISGVFTYTKKNSHIRRRLSDGISYEVTADVYSGRPAEEVAMMDVRTPIVEELKKDDDLKDVKVDVSSVSMRQVEVVEIVEEEAVEDQTGTTTTTSVTTTTSITTTTTTTTTQAPAPSCGQEKYKGDGYCDDDNNNAGCEFDGGDCCEKSLGGPLKTDYCKECKCLDPNPQAQAPSCGIKKYKGDGSCDDENNNAGCDFDGSDCCEKSLGGPV